jgi:hypothetical protein
MALDEALVKEIESTAETTDMSSPGIIEPAHEQKKEETTAVKQDLKIAGTNDELQANIKAAEESKAAQEEAATEDKGTTEEAARVQDAASEVTDEKNEEGSEEGKSQEGSSDESDGKPAKKAKNEPVISDAILQKAVLAGVPLNDAKVFPSEDSLLRVVNALEMQHEEMAKLQAAAAEQQEEEEPDILDDIPDLDPEEYDENLIGAMDRIKEKLRKQEEELREFRASQETAISMTEQRNVAEVTQWFDSEVEKLGDGFAEALGKGGRASLTPGSSQLAKRDDIAHQMAIMLGGYAAVGQTPPPREAVFQQAAKLVLADEYEKQRSVGLSEKLKTRASQHIARATGQKTETQLSPEDEAAAAINSKWFIK